MDYPRLDWTTQRKTPGASKWQGIQVITDYKSKVSTPVTTDASLPAELNNFYTRFETSAQAQSSITALSDSTEEEPPLILAADEVRRAPMRVSTRKATGPDGIAGWTLKACASKLASTFTDIFYLSLAQSTVSVCFKATTIIPIPKKSIITCMNDYRSHTHSDEVLRETHPVSYKEKPSQHLGPTSEQIY
ncbi:hypothetical protein NFI96_007158 [Prochilodus magdalenae]|nr:hypothetical protein NFI96_007158 [Prochilodus magdalenae]